MASNFEYLFYGFLAAWLIVAIYVVLLGMRERKLDRELDRVRRMVSPDHRTPTVREGTDQR